MRRLAPAFHPEVVPRWVPALAAAAVAVFACVVLGVGWGLGVDAAKGFAPTRATVRPLTAACLLLLSVSLWLLTRGGRRWARIGMLCAGLALAMSLLSLAQHAFGLDFGVDRVLFAREIRATDNVHPGRMAVDSAAGEALLAAAHLALLLHARRSVLVSQVLAAGAGLLGITIVYSTLYSLSSSVGESGRPRGLALTAALALTVLCVGTVGARPAEGLGGILAGGSVGAVMGRRMLAGALVVPFALGWLPILAQHNGRYDARFAVAALITGNAAVFALVAIVAARAASRLETMGIDAQQAAREGHEQLLALIDNTSAVIYIRDLDGRYQLINREYERLFDCSRDQVVGQTDHDLFPAGMADEFRANDLAAIARGTPIQMEEIAPGGDGPHTYITVKFPLVDTAGLPYAICGISTDITDRKRAEDEVQRLNTGLELRVRERTAELEASTKELDAFAYSVSHDLRAPLRSLDGFSQVLLEDYAAALDETGRDYLHRVQANAVRMGQLIDGLLDLSRNTRVTLTRSGIDLGELAGEVVADLRAAEPERAVQVIIADGLRATADPELSRLVLQNLIGNAWKFSGKDAAPGTIELGAVEQDGERVFFVRDNGAGFNMRYAAKLFEPFQRLHSRDEFEGSGLGLAIVQRIVNRHGGRIWAESEPGNGAVFYFTLGARTEVSR